MGPLGMAVLLSELLIPTGLLAQEHQDLSTQEPVRTLHMTFDPRKMILAWDCRQDATVVECLMIHKEEGQISMEPMEKQCNCIFELRSLHGGVLLIVKANTSQGLFEEKLKYHNPGGNGTAAENFSCFMYDEDFMNCTWAKGRAAPGDVQYFFYIRDSEGETERECPHYLEHSGTHVGCHVKDISGLTFYSYFLVNGSSRGTGIQFFDSILSKNDIKRYSPPINITVNCNHSHCLLKWQRPKAQQHVSARELKYEVDIQRKGHKDGRGHKPIPVPGNWGNKHNFPINPRARYTVRIRTANSRILHWGPWSEPVEFGFEEGEGSPEYVYVLVVLGTLLGTLLIGCLFKRFLVMHALFPPIPKIKDKLNDSQQTGLQVSWNELMLGTGKAENEEVVTVEEVA
ncbi:granulocyte-macrophage colony-stimulating factor receptor subunit alpha-like [Dugong dugon]